MNHSHSKWLRSVLQNHTAFLMANPNREELLGPVYSMLEARTKHYAPLVQLKGKLNLISKQMNTKPEETSNVDPNKEALLGKCGIGRKM